MPRSIVRDRCTLKPSRPHSRKHLISVPASPDAAGRRVPAERTVTRRVRRTALALGIGAGWLGLAAVAVVYLGGLMLEGVARGVALLPRAVVWLFLALQDGADWWSIAGRAGAAVAASLATSQVVWWLIALELVGVAALAGLQVMLRDEIRRADSEEVKK
jgi:hypothetical protein